MSAAMGVAERLLALETAVAELQAGGHAGVQGKEAPAAPSTDTERLARLLGNSRLASLLASAGYGSPAAVAAATDGELLEIDGVAEKALKLIREKVTG